MVDFTWYLRNLLLVGATGQADFADVATDKQEAFLQEAKAYCSWLTKRIREKNNNDSLKVCLPEINEIIELFEKHCNLEDKIQAVNCIMTDHTIPIGVLPFYEGISDLIGNVWEWSETGYEFEDDYIITCYGGCWGKEINSKNLRTTYPSKLQSNNIGFRVIIKNI